jgi:REP element-mobilizing transposase RayT
MSITIPTEPDRTYHIYNQGVNRIDIFNRKSIYFKFHKNIIKYLYPIAKVYAWCLMPNHYHMLVTIKSKSELSCIPAFKNLTEEDKIIDKIHRQFSHMMNSYTRYFNPLNSRTGPLFDKSLQKKPVTDLDYFYYLITYIHNNPVHHGFCQNAEDYKWSSYYNYRNEKSRTDAMKEMIADFGGIDAFLLAHKEGPKNINSSIDIV